MEQTITLNELRVGQSAVVWRLDNPAPMRRRLLDIGLVPNSVVRCVGISPGGDPAAYRICRAVVAIRREDGRLVRVYPLEGEDGAWA